MMHSKKTPTNRKVQRSNLNYVLTLVTQITYDQKGNGPGAISLGP